MACNFNLLIFSKKIFNVSQMIKHFFRFLNREEVQAFFFFWIFNFNF